jgi:hypothetical protein
MWSALPKIQRRVKTLRYSSCDDTPTAATIAVTTGGVSLLICKNILFYFDRVGRQWLSIDTTLES